VEEEGKNKEYMKVDRCYEKPLHRRISPKGRVEV